MTVLSPSFDVGDGIITTVAGTTGPSRQLCKDDKWIGDWAPQIHHQVFRARSKHVGQ